MASNYAGKLKEELDGWAKLTGATLKDHSGTEERNSATNILRVHYADSGWKDPGDGSRKSL